MGAILSCLCGSHWDSHDDERTPLLNGVKHGPGTAQDDGEGSSSFQNGVSDFARRNKELSLILNYMNYHLLDVSQLEQISQREKSPDHSDSEVDQQNLDNHRSAKDFRRALRGRKSVYPKHAMTDEENDEEGDDAGAGQNLDQAGSAINSHSSADKLALGATHSVGAARLRGADGAKAPLGRASTNTQPDYAPAARPVSTKEARAMQRQNEKSASIASSSALGSDPTSTAAGQISSSAATAGAGAASSLSAAANSASSTASGPESLSPLDSNGLFDDWEIVAAPLAEKDRAWLNKKSRAAWQAYTRDAQIHADGPLLIAFS